MESVHQRDRPIKQSQLTQLRRNNVGSDRILHVVGPGRLGLVWLYILFATGPHMALGAPQEQELARLAR